MVCLRVVLTFSPCCFQISVLACVAAAMASHPPPYGHPAPHYVSRTSTGLGQTVTLGLYIRVEFEHLLIIYINYVVHQWLHIQSVFKTSQ